MVTDLRCWINVVDEDSGKVVPDGYGVMAPAKLKIRYNVKNDGQAPLGPFWVVGALMKDGVRLQPNPVPAQQINKLPAGKTWEADHVMTEASFPVTYKAYMLGDVGNWIKEDDESNNKASSSFMVTPNQ
jgi:hypothetical protein